MNTLCYFFVFVMCWTSKTPIIEEYKMINEHRKIGKELDLFDLSEHSNGMVSWHSKGFSIYKKIEDYLRCVLDCNDHEEVKSPLMASSELWRKSGHLEKYKSGMYLLDVDGKENAIKPMNCPFHIEIFNKKMRSYKDLPVRLVEFGHCHRNESSGSLNGLLRLRSFIQDDGHVFCRESQIGSELAMFMNMLFDVYEKFGFNRGAISIKISLRPSQRVGSDELWDKAEDVLKASLSEMGIPYEILEGEGAFYGPKVEISLKDSLNREWQCGTFQLDFFLAERLGCSYINEKGEQENPIILHRALLGSLERFIAILIEHYSGKLPLWLNPNAIKIIPVGESHLAYAEKIKKEIKMSLGVNVVIDSSEDSLSYKMRNHFKNKGCYSIIVGDKEIEGNLISVREKKRSSVMSLEEFIKKES